MSDLEQRTDVEARALARVVEQFKHSPRLLAALSAWAGRFQELEDSLWSLFTERWISGSGVQLDQLGEIVGQPREGRDDTEYRLWISARVRANRSNGHGDDTLRILELIASEADYFVQETPPAAYRVDAVGLGSDPAAIFQILRLAKPAGVRLDLTYSEEDPEFLFTLAPAGTLVTGDNDKGFANDAQTTGGHLTGVFSV